MNLIKPVYAAIKNPVIQDSASISSNPTGYVNNIIQTVITILIIAGVIFFVFNFIFAGYKIMSSGGDPKKYEEGQKSLINSLIGIAIVFSIFAILKIVGTVFGITGLSSLSITLPSL